MQLNSIAELLEDVRLGRMVILVDDEDRENEGDLVVAADCVTPEIINFMATKARGLICLSLTALQIEKLGIPLMVNEVANGAPNKTAFTVSVEAASGVTTGISAADRARTIKVASNPDARPQDVIVPGHIFPIRAQEGGVLKRAGHTEASLDIVRLAGLNPAAVICEIMNPDGTMARLPELVEFARRYGLKIGTIESLIKHRIQTETFVQPLEAASFPSRFGEGFEVRVFRNLLDGCEHLAIVKGQVDGNQPVLVRVHTECVLGDVFGSLHSRSGEYLEQALRLIDRAGCGVVVYLRQENVDSKLLRSVRAYRNFSVEPLTLDEKTLRKPFLADDREYGLGAQILRQLGVAKILLISNNASKRVGLKGYGLEIVDTVAVHLDDPVQETAQDLTQKPLSL